MKKDHFSVSLKFHYSMLTTIITENDCHDYREIFHLVAMGFGQQVFITILLGVDNAYIDNDRLGTGSMLYVKM